MQIAGRINKLPKGWRLGELKTNFAPKSQLKFNQSVGDEKNERQKKSMNELDCRLKSLNHKRLIKRNKN